MSSLRITAEVSLSAHYDAACRDAIDLATKIGVPVNFSFNGVDLVAKPFGNWRILVNKYRELARIS